MKKKVLYKIDKQDNSVTLKDVLEMIEDLQQKNPDQDVFFDGDEYAVCSRPKRKIANQ
ncbi:MAG: hypothetical protein V3U51_06115 [Thermoplasmata archaeon]